MPEGLSVGAVLPGVRAQIAGGRVTIEYSTPFRKNGRKPTADSQGGEPVEVGRPKSEHLQLTRTRDERRDAVATVVSRRIDLVCELCKVLHCAHQIRRRPAAEDRVLIGHVTPREDIRVPIAGIHAIVASEAGEIADGSSNREKGAGEVAVVEDFPLIEIRPGARSRRIRA